MKEKRIWALFALFVAAVMLFAPEYTAPDNTIQGTVVARRAYPNVLELALPDGTNYGILLDENTQVTYHEYGTAVDGTGYMEQGATIKVTLGDQVESAWPAYDACVEGWYRAQEIKIVDGVQFVSPGSAVGYKPVIYLYPEQVTDVTVRLDYDWELTCVYPAYEGLWSVTAAPDGTLTDAKGMEYNYLYWEGVGMAAYDWSKGFCVAGADTAAFLETALHALGLTRREANEFIVYWLPLMEGNPYNLIAFQGDAYTDTAKLTVDPAPDTELRVFMAWKRLDSPVEIEPQELTAPERTGFVLVEWGGSEVK